MAAGDVDVQVDQLLVQEVLNPETGLPNGARAEQRHVLRLLPLDGPRPRAEALRDPYTGEWLLRVRWRDEDALRRTVCFTCDCNELPVHDVSVFHGNLVLVTQGRPRITTFRAPGAPLGPLDEHALVATDEAAYEVVWRDRKSVV